MSDDNRKRAASDEPEGQEASKRPHVDVPMTDESPPENTETSSFMSTDMQFIPRNKESAQFILYTTNAKSFSNMIEMVGGLLASSSLCLRVSNTSDFKGISISSLDKNKVSMIRAHLEFDYVYINEKDTYMIEVDKNDILNALNLIDDSCLIFRQEKDGDLLTIQNCDTFHTPTANLFQFYPVQNSQDGYNNRNLDITSFRNVAEFNVQKFKKFIKINLSNKSLSSRIEVKIEVFVRNNQVELTRIYYTFHGDGVHKKNQRIINCMNKETQIENQYYVTEVDKPMDDIKLDSCEAQVVYHESLDAYRILNFLKHIGNSRTFVKIYMQKDNPFVMECPLHPMNQDDPKNTCLYYIAPFAQDDEDEDEYD